MIMQVEHLSKSFGGRTLFSDVTFKPGGIRPPGARRPQRRRQDHHAQHHQRPRGRRRGPGAVRKGRARGLPGAGSHRDGRSPHLRGGHVLAGGDPGSRAAPARAGGVAGREPHRAQLAAAGRARDAYEMLGGYTIEAKVRGVLFGLGFKEGDISAAQPRASPAAGRCASRWQSCSSAIPRCCMLDEPTNHLDLESREVARGLPARLRGHRHRGQPRPRVHGQHGGPRCRGGQRPASTYTRATTPPTSRRARSASSACVPSSAPSRPEEIAAPGGLRREASATRPPKPSQAQERAQRLERLKEERIEIPEEKKPIHFNFVQPPRTGDEVVRCPRPGEGLRRQARLRQLRLHHVPRRQDGACGPQRRGQIHAA